MTKQRGADRPTRTNRVESVYEQLRWDIVHGVVRPNEPLNETELADRLGVSRTPVRESLQRLATDGLIVLRRRRWLVYEHTAEEVRELYEVRACQESFAGRLACERGTDKQIRAIVAARKLATQRTGPAARVANNDTFHDLVNQASGNTRLRQLILGTRLYHFNQRVAALYTDEEFATSSRQHGEIIDAIAARDADEAERVIRTHVLTALDITLRTLY